MTRENWFIDFAKITGRRDLPSFAIGTIRAIISDGSYSNNQKISEIEDTLASLTQAWNDETLPWNVETSHE